MRARTGTTAAFVLCCAVLAACTQSTSGAAAPSGANAPQPAEGTAELAAYYDQQLSWGACEEFAVGADDRQSYANPAFDCAQLEVPVDYAAPDGEKAQIALLRQKASGDKIGSLLFNPGGPGASGMSLVANLAGALTASPLSQRFDLIGFDPRGVGASTPTIDCLTNDEWEVERADLDVDPSPAGVQQTEAENEEYAQRCTERSGGAAFLANSGTRDVVRDMDIMRQALGDEKLSYVGYSYGTRIGSAYAEAFPQNVRALVLDGALDPKETTIERTVKQNAGFQQAFDAYAADCARNPACPLGTDPAGATAAFQALTRPLIDQPVAVGNRTLSYGDAVTGVIQALYAEDFWPVLTQGISGLASGNGRILLALADLYYGRGEDGSYDNKIEAFTAISCMDEERIADRAQQEELTRRANEAAPFRDDGRGAVGALDPCAFWPAEPTSRPHTPQVAGLPPTVVVSVTGDPATPYQAGVDLAQALGGSLISVEGNQHTAALQGNQCIDDVVNAYLIDLAVPQGETSCTL